jgi:hypothetical protein
MVILAQDTSGRSPARSSQKTTTVMLSAQFMSDERVAMFELKLQNDLIVVVDEKHYRLVPATELDRVAILNYR